ncbi:restriction endonuclease [Corynebacterium sp. NML140438]|uniref:NaeI family type II restriction endonuclease n=1 Tax=Corynebacterium sp. NML140438 TaxID=1906334 RepID=UPI0008FADBF4|nr:NaeI family type II restriction endonuclease [Corynebacterium sp. NML140438]OIR41620.1 restriction endonuclease [Corynebacterium sp. NML140438]
MTDTHEGDFSYELAELFRSKFPDGETMGRIFRQTFDQAFDGQHTGRFSPSQLSKTELAHIGSLVEINIRRRFDGIITDGDKMDFKILGQEVDCKYSKSPYGWMIPMEAVGHHAMLCHADEATSTFRVGFIKITDDILTAGGNRDRKRTIKAAARKNIEWAWFDHPYPSNVLLHADADTVASIMHLASGQQRLDMLFRSIQQVLIPRGIVYTVAQQKDPMKRIRYNGGSRSRLQDEGILILGDYRRHQAIAEALLLPICRDGDSLAVRVVPAEPDFVGPVVEIERQAWRIATEADPVHRAPRLPF